MNAFFARGAVAAFVTATAICGAGCSTPPQRIDFTSALRTDWNFSDDEIRQLQFYTHDGVALERDLGGDARSVAHGKLVVRDGHNIEVIEIPAETPGIATTVSKGAIDICFEGSCDSTLTFQYPADPNYPNFAGNYVSRVSHLTASSGGYSGQVEYAGNTYTLHPLTSLQIDLQSLRRTENRRMVPGKRIGERPAQ